MNDWSTELSAIFYEESMTIKPLLASIFTDIIILAAKCRKKVPGAGPWSSQREIVCTDSAPLKGCHHYVTLHSKLENGPLAIWRLQLLLLWHFPEAGTEVHFFAGYPVGDKHSCKCRLLVFPLLKISVNIKGAVFYE